MFVLFLDGDDNFFLEGIMVFILFLDFLDFFSVLWFLLFDMFFFGGVCGGELSLLKFVDVLLGNGVLFWFFVVGGERDCVGIFFFGFDGYGEF